MQYIQSRETTLPKYYLTRPTYVLALDICLLIFTVIVVSLGVYFYFFFIEEIYDVKVLDVTHNISVIKDTLVPCKSKLQIQFTAVNLQSATLLVSTDKTNAVFYATSTSTINESNRVEKSNNYVVEWIVPEYILSDTCQLKIQSKSSVSVYAVSNVFRITPVFTLVEFGTIPDREYYVPGIIQIKYDGIQEFRPKFSIYYSEEQTITDTTGNLPSSTFIDKHLALPDGCYYDNDTNNSIITLYLTSEMNGKSVYFQIITNNLTAYYDRELIVETLYKVSLTSTKFRGSYVDSGELKFESLIVTDDITTSSGGSFNPNDVVWVSYKLTGGTLADSDIMWLLRIGDSDYSEITLTSTNNGFYQWVIPSNVYPTFNLRLTSKTNRNAYIDTGKLICNINLSITRCIVNCADEISVILSCIVSGLTLGDIRNYALWTLTNSEISDSPFVINNSIIYIPATKLLEITATNKSTAKCLKDITNTFTLTFNTNVISASFKLN